MAEIGHAALPIIPSMRGVEGKLNSGLGPIMDRQGAQAGRTFGDKFGSAAKTAVKASLVGVGALAVGAFQIGKAAVNEASDLGESLNAVNVSYGKNSKAVKDLGRQAADTLGLSNSQFNSLAVRFSAFSRQIAGSEGKKVVTTLDDLTTRAADFASVMNLDVNEAARLFQSGLAGETEPLRQFGIDLSAAKVEAFAYANGITKVGEELTEGEKVQARYGALMEQTAQTQGDFANTSDSLANRQRILNARWDDAQAKLGKALLPIFEDFAGFLIKEGIPAVEGFSDWFNDEGVPALKDFGGFVREDVLPVLEDIGGFAKTAGGHVKDMVGFFGDLPTEAKIAGLAGLVAGVAALKVRGGGKGALGTAGSALGLAKPVPVFVVNPGFGAGGVPGKPGGGTPPVAVPGGGLPGKTTWVSGAAGGSWWSRFLRGAPMLGAATGMRELEPLKDVIPASWTKGVDDAARSMGRLTSAQQKAFRELEIGTGQAEKFAEEVFGLGQNVDKVKGRHEVRLVAPGFESLLARTTTYSDILNDLDGRVVRTHVRNTIRNNVVYDDGGVIGPGRTPGGGGRGGVHVQNMTVKADDPNRWKREMEHIRLANAVGGADFRG